MLKKIIILTAFLSFSTEAFADVKVISFGVVDKVEVSVVALQNQLSELYDSTVTIEAVRLANDFLEVASSIYYQTYRNKIITLNINETLVQMKMNLFQGRVTLTLLPGENTQGLDLPFWTRISLAEIQS